MTLYLTLLFGHHNVIYWIELERFKEITLSGSNFS